MDPAGVFATSFDQDQALVRTRSQAVTLGLFVMFMFALPWIADARSVAVMTSMLITAVVVIGLQINTGLAGQINLGQAAFMGAGAYATALLATKGGTGQPLQPGQPGRHPGRSGMLAGLAG